MSPRFRLAPCLCCPTLWLNGLLASVAVAQSASDSLQCDRLYPAAVAVGATSTLTAEGKFPSWPVAVYSDRDDVALRCLEKNGQLEIDAPADAPPGLLWLRLGDPQGVSPPLPLLLENADVVMEQEPNDSPSATSVVSLPAVVCGKLQKSEDVDGVRVDVVADRTFVASLISNPLLSGDMDAVLQITDLAGNVVAQSDDEVGIDPQITYVPPANAQLIVRWFAFPATPNSTIGFAGGAGYVYCLRLSQGSVLDHVLPLVQSPTATDYQAFGWNLAGGGPGATAPELLPATTHAPLRAILPGSLGWQWLPPTLADDCHVYLEASDSPTAARLPALFAGHIATAGEVDRWRFHVAAGKKIRCHVLARSFGFPLDSVIEIRDLASGDLLARNDDASRDDYDASLDFTPKADTAVELSISDLAKSASLRHAYSIHVFQVAPDVRLTAAVDRVSLQPGKQTELTIAVSRLDGFDHRLELSAEDLPPGVTAQPVLSEAKGDSSKSVKLQLTADASAAAAQVPFRIVAHRVPAAAEPPAQATPEAGEPVAAWPVRFPLRPQVALDQLWLTVTPQ